MAHLHMPASDDITGVPPAYGPLHARDGRKGAERPQEQTGPHPTPAPQAGEGRVGAGTVRYYRDGRDKPGHDQMGMARSFAPVTAERPNSFKLLTFVWSCLFPGILTNLHPSARTRNA